MISLVLFLFRDKLLALFQSSLDADLLFMLMRPTTVESAEGTAVDWAHSYDGLGIKCKFYTNILLSKSMSKQHCNRCFANDVSDHYVIAAVRDSEVPKSKPILLKGEIWKRLLSRDFWEIYFFMIGAELPWLMMNENSLDLEKLMLNFINLKPLRIRITQKDSGKPFRHYLQLVNHHVFLCLWSRMVWLCLKILSFI